MNLIVTNPVRPTGSQRMASHSSHSHRWI